ncbi:hypothetical protein CVT25_004311 [Psilocybe cyanescens]|uniref:Uncharacterized protein n=1 Tax=Psilocybe cyanescens TaxID=93625 RepID=A0A409XPT3_PSICY|nr:hypothetical protein CVT25_004311 [Psilocybe cyanescens]
MPQTVCFYRLTGIHSLPVELISSIFLFGAGFDNPYVDSPFLLKPDQEYEPVPSSDFQVIVSHVCHHWRQVALNTQSLWTTLHFGHPSHLSRAEVYLARCSTSTTFLLDILVNTVASETHDRDPQRTLYDAELLAIFQIIVPHVKRWRAFHLKISDNLCKSTARRFLSSCGPAPYLETLQLYHFEDYRTSQRLFEAIHKPPVTIFSNVLPRLRNVSLIGVNLGWDDSPYLSSLHTLELALHSENVRPLYASWGRILQSSPELKTLCLHYSGPRASTDDPNLAWPRADRKIQLKGLKQLNLTSLDPDYLCDLVDRLYFLNLQGLNLDLPDLEYTSFITLLTGPVLQTSSDICTQTQVTTSSNSSLISNSTNGTSTSISPKLPTPSLANLQTLVIHALDCTLKSWTNFLQGMQGLRSLEVDFGRVGDRKLFWSVFIQPCTALTFGNEDDRMASCPIQVELLLPRLETFKFAGISGRDVLSALTYRYRHRSRISPTTQIWTIGWGGRRREDIELGALIERGFWMPNDSLEEVKVIIKDFYDEEEVEGAEDGDGEEELFED